ncbi:preprotein translocase subunit YajC [Aliidiomarina maris]|uniref:Sec translocon accessory complex subunit YajC n=1 Tax=Aliidiomarina maris TaxID=531312 RepID=A0A327WRJ2_9GAMM|nr:preprotein translocase subunit YajC [Aliidiomarina maris]MBA3988500.1 preprotein translocase subunit YajC [Idiomarina sp.]MCL5049537.1 preprotein translocase subunit YajC [Bacillota bacterium]RAJ95372.1 protein translocase subunit yajC [Aliidiomarina maris]RUO22736.1 preprotein translocase subunit YajC [Aliidiomarina maris]
MDFLISSAHAAAPAGQAEGSTLSLFIMLAVFGLIFYFMIYRPQAKRVKEHKSLVSALTKGDEVLIQGGLVGRISKVADDNDFMVIAVADNVEMTVQKGAVAAVLPKGTIKTL